MLVWFLRRGFWNNIAWFKFKMAKPLDIDMLLSLLRVWLFK